MDWLLPLFVISRVPKPSRAALAEQLLPIALPGPSSQRLALAAIGAERQLKRQALTEQRLVEEAIKAGKFTSPADLVSFPALELAFKRLPVPVQTVIFSTG
jgi:hypothetical protein